MKKIIVCFDESGDFEGANVNNSFICGFCYISESGEDLKNERERICSFFKKVCSETKAEFPSDLHNKNRNITSSLYNKYMCDFLDTAKYNSSPLLSGKRKRSGEYIVFLMSYEQSYYKKTPVLEIMDDNNGANRYGQMTKDLLSNLLAYFSGKDTETEIYFDLPTRANDSGSFEVVGLDYTYTDPNSRDKWSITNNSFFQSFLGELQTQKIFKSGKLNIKELRVTPFTRDYDKKEENEQHNVAFHYLSDAICCYIKQENVNDIDSLLKQLNSLSNNTLFWTYGRVNQLFLEIQKLLLEKDYIKTLYRKSELEKIKEDPSYAKEVDYYLNTWINPKLESVFEKMNPRDIRNLTNSLNNITYTIGEMRSNMEGIEYAAKYLQELILKKYKDTQNTSLIDAIFFVYDTIVCVYNHSGRSADSLTYIKAIDDLSDKISNKTLIVSRKNRYITPLIDSFMIDEAFCQARDAYANAKFKQGSEEKARAYSQFAQVTELLTPNNSFLLENNILTKEQWEKNKELIPKHFKKSLEIWSNNNDSVNYRMTLNFYLHYLIDEAQKNPCLKAKMLEKYLEHSSEYFFKKESLKKQLNESLKVISSDPYAMHLWLKGLVEFYDEDYIKRTISEEKIQRMLDCFEIKHPWESIVLYAYEIKWILSDSKDNKRECINSFDNYMKRFSNKYNNDVIGCVVEVNKIAFYKFTGAKPKKSLLVEKINNITHNQLLKSEKEAIDYILFSYR